MSVLTAIVAYQESAHAKWPIVFGTITQQTVREAIDAKSRSKVWYIQSELRYSVDGEELTSSVRSHGTGSTEQRAMMRKWTSQHPPGASLPIRYDPRHHSTVVLDAGDMPESGSPVPGDLQMLLLFSVLSVTLITIGRVLGRRQLTPS